MCVCNVCVCVCERERVGVCVCIQCVCVREREWVCVYYDYSLYRSLVLDGFACAKCPTLHAKWYYTVHNNMETPHNVRMTV